MNKNGGRRQVSKGALRKEMGARIVRARRCHGWSQVELAQRLGVSRERLGQWERGRNPPGLEELALLSEVLAVPLGELVLGPAAVEPEPFSAVEMMELARYYAATARLLKPWMDRLREAKGAARGQGKERF